VVSSKTYGELKAAMPDRFRLDMLDSIFESWLKSSSSAAVALPTKVGIPLMYEYIHDHHSYTATAYLSQWSSPKHPSRTNTELVIKLANDSFLYPRPSELSVLPNEDNVSRHHSMYWCALSTETHVQNFQKLLGFCKSYLESDTVKLRIYFNFVEDRLDFKAFHGDRGVVITFEPGYPCDDDFDTDHWQTA
jgi:hypothetical protein